MVRADVFMLVLKMQLQCSLVENCELLNWNISGALCHLVFATEVSTLDVTPFMAVLLSATAIILSSFTTVHRIF